MISTIEHHQQHLQLQQQQQQHNPRESTTTPDSSEEGFVSGGSLPEESFDRLAMQISSFGISTQNKNSVYASYLEKPIEEFANSLLKNNIRVPDGAGHNAAGSIH